MTLCSPFRLATSKYRLNPINAVALAAEGLEAAPVGQAVEASADHLPVSRY